ncbi:Tetratricopeptide repeat protein 28 [Parachaetomium inaequale]|uniref:Tetratricopeptide repeat protein 28 n=1 Tax=Parachaetomium inaequale TaxID=2588326 RepID=A0AAN6P8Q5_9PEZI|nr:Tetratricopeptide repeat protein 28 [Parachaetomium inaequale]
MDDTAPCYVPLSSLQHVLEGVSAASLAPADYVGPVATWLAQQDDQETNNRPLLAWRSAVEADLSFGGPREVAYLTLAVAFLRETGRKSLDAGADDLELVWNSVHTAISSPHLPRPLCTVSRSAQGFLAVPLCSLLKDGNIDELFRLHVWLPDGHRGNPDFAIHSHQPFAQSWILAGEGVDLSYDVEPSKDAALSTHSTYEVAWNDGKGQGAAYKTHQTYSIVQNTGTPMRASLRTSRVHARNMTYTIPAGAFHSTKVAPDLMHATLFFFDSHRGFTPRAPVLGPRGVDSFKQLRDPAGVTAKMLAERVQLLLTWEMLVERGRHLAKTSELEFALVALNDALVLCESSEDFPNAPYYRGLVLGELGSLNRRLGRYQKAREILEAAIGETEPSLQRVEMSGELGVVYRHMNLVDDAKRAFEMQYETAKELGSEQAMCRAIGNLGIVNYQLSQQMLQLATEQLKERVERARRLRETPDAPVADPNKGTGKLTFAATQEIVGHARLSLCHAAQGKTRQAVDSALASLNLSFTLEATQKDSTLVAFSRFFYGRALLLDGQRAEALKQFNPPPPSCTPAMAMCKEPSDEHRKYLEELVDARADMDLVDEQGYTALDYAAFSGDTASEELVLEGLRRKYAGDPDIEDKLKQRRAEARLRRRYRELFQEKMRPILLRHRGADALRELRRVYADTLSAEEESGRIFDRLKFMRWRDFVRHGELLRSSEALTSRFETSSGGAEASFVIFFSYRWINKDKSASTPDDADKTQYRRMKAAVEEFLRMHSSVDPETLGIWVDISCVNQDSAMPGVNALPMILAQCNAVISLVDDLYYTRAWCAIEVVMIQKLKRAYDVHLWYEQVATGTTPSGESTADHFDAKTWFLRAGPLDLEITLAEKHLTFEEDRPKVLFLERQSKLLA